MSKVQEVQSNLNTAFLVGGEEGVYLAAKDHTIQRHRFTDLWSSLNSSLKDKVDKDKLQDLICGEVVQSETPEMTPSDLKELAEEYLDAMYRVCDVDCVRLCYEIIDADKKLVKQLRDYRNARPVLRGTLRRLIFAEKKITYSTRVMDDAISIWWDHAIEIDKPVPMANDLDDVWCLHKNDLKPDKNVTCETWDDMLEHMNDYEAFLAWQWGVYSGEYDGRQALWLYGPHSKDGKSSMAKVLGSLYGPALGAISNNTLKSKSRFLNSAFENTSLVEYPDAAPGTGFLMTETFKHITSGLDPVQIERKGEAAYFAILTAKAWIHSNYEPEFSGDEFATSRVLLITMDKNTCVREAAETFTQKLTDQLPGLLYKAQEAYKVKCRENQEILVNEAVQDSMDQIVAAYDEPYEEFFNQFFEVASPDHFVYTSEIRTVAREWKQRDENLKFFVINLNRWMLRIFDVVPHKSKGGQRRISGIALKGSVVVKDPKEDGFNSKLIENTSF